MSRTFTIFLLLLSTLAFLYSLMGIALAYWIAAVPGNSPQRIWFNLIFWSLSSLATFVVSVALFVRLLKPRR